MTKDLRVYLDDIVKSGDRIAKYIRNHDLGSFENDDQLQDAVVKRLEVIGEAVKRLPEEFRNQHSHISWRGATGTRDWLVHHYDDINPKQVWITATEVLPRFKEQVEKLMGEL